MKTKLLCLALLLAATGGSLFAQNPTAVTGTILDPNSVPYYPAQVTACLTPNTLDPTVGGKHVNPNIGTNYCLTTQTAADGSFSLSLHANGNITPAATQWIFTVQTVGAAPPAGKGSQTFSTSAVTVSGSTQSVTASFTGLPALLNSGSGSGSTAPNLNVQSLARNCGNQANCTQVKWNAGSSPAPTSSTPVSTTTSGSNLVTCPDCKFQTGVVGTGTPPANVGQIFFATDSTGTSWGGCLNNPSILFGGAAQTTISSVDSDTQIHVVGNAGTSSAGHACIAWGDDDTAAINAGWVAGGCTTTLSMPQGMTFVSAPLWQKNPGCVYNGGGPYYGQRVMGPNFGLTYLIPTPNFNFASITGGQGTAVSCTNCTAAFGSPFIFEYKDFGIFGLGQRCSTLTSTDLFMAGTAARLINIAGVGWCGQGGGPSLIGFHFLGGEDLFSQSGANFFGSIQTAVDAQLVTFQGDYVTGMSSNTATVFKCVSLVGNFQDGASLYIVDSITQGCLVAGDSVATNSGSIVSMNSQVWGNPNGTADAAAIFLGKNSTINLTSNDQVCQVTCGSNETGVQFISTGSALHASYSAIGANGTAKVITGAAGNTFEDHVGNSFSPIAAGRWNGLGRWVGDGSIVQFSAPTISSGFGTSPAILKESGATSFTVNVGTGGVATAGVIGLTAANAGWTCSVYNQTAHASNRADDTVQTANTTTTVTFQNQTKSTGAAVAWTASDTLNASCRAN